MTTVHDNKSDDEYSVIGDKGDIGFVDLENSICSYNPSKESHLFNISVPFPLVNGKPKWGYVGETISDPIIIKNTTDEPLDLWSITIYNSKPENSFTLSLMEPPNSNSDEQYIQDFMESFTLEDRVLNADKTLMIWLSCKPKEIGLHSTAVHFTIGDDTIERMAHVLAEDKISKSLSSSKPYCRARKNKINVVNVYSSDVPFVVGQRPSRGPDRGFKFRLPKYPIPQNIREMVINRQIPDAVNEGLSRQNHSSFFKALLAMEEIKMEEDMREYNMECVNMKSKGYTFLTLDVPGLAERRPSLVNGDYILAKLASDDGRANHAYQGYIHRVEAEEIYLKFDPQLHKIHRDSNLYNVQFTYNRTGMRRLYQAIENSETMGNNYLFPSLTKKKPVQPAPLVPILCTLNEEQMSAVKMILACKGGSPYIIHGPPGTGKTMTLIEAILQIYNSGKKTRILVCAPSNSAADHLLERLISEKSKKIQKNEIFRLNAFSRPFEDVNPDFMEFCCVEDLIFQCPSKWDLQEYRIIISTYTSASVLYSEGIKRGHFSYIFLDEAGQASEPETMVPLSHFFSKNTVVVLAGDPMQLGPVVFSKDAENYGLGISYMERLLNSEYYSNGNFMTKLVRNYRTHPAVLYLPSKLFYEGELIPCQEENSDFLTSLKDFLPNKEFPLVFVGVQGYDEREGGNPSWFNRTEASKVVKIINVLIKEMGLKEEAIGVITPYKQQVLKIRGVLGRFSRQNIKVGSVEQFQGQERQVIIISTVRSTIKHNEFDRVHYLGFLSNPRRFNVSITRARSLFIVIGNPHILCKDPHWHNLLWYCVDNGSYKGCFLPEREELSVEGPPETEFYNEENNVQPWQLSESEAQWGWEGDNNTWQNFESQLDCKGNNCQSSENQWGWEGDTNWQNSESQLDVKGNNNLQSSEVEWGLEGDNNWQNSEVNNGEPSEASNENLERSSEVKLGVEEISNQLNDISWGNAENIFVPSDIP